MQFLYNKLILEHSFFSLNLRLICFAGWGPHAYFQMLAESRNEVQASSPNANNINVQQSEIESVYIQPQHEMRFNTQDSSPMLNR